MQPLKNLITIDHRTAIIDRLALEEAREHLEDYALLREILRSYLNAQQPVLRSLLLRALNNDATWREEAREWTGPL
jgi:hypothetical protein